MCYGGPIPICSSCVLTGNIVLTCQMNSFKERQTYTTPYSIAGYEVLLATVPARSRYASPIMARSHLYLPILSYPASELPSIRIDSFPFVMGGRNGTSLPQGASVRSSPGFYEPLRVAPPRTELLRIIVFPQVPPSSITLPTSCLH